MMARLMRPHLSSFLACIPIGVATVVVALLGLVYLCTTVSDGGYSPYPRNQLIDPRDTIHHRGGPQYGRTPHDSFYDNPPEYVY